MDYLLLTSIYALSWSKNYLVYGFVPLSSNPMKKLMVVDCQKINFDDSKDLIVLSVLTLQQQLQALMDTLNTTEPHYIRCVKPNTGNRPQKFENQSVLHQLRCGVSTSILSSESVHEMSVSLSITLTF